MKEEAVPVPRRRSSAYSDDNVVPVKESSHFWGSTKKLGETPLVSSSFF